MSKILTYCCQSLILLLLLLKTAAASTPWIPNVPEYQIYGSFMVKPAIDPIGNNTPLVWKKYTTRSLPCTNSADSCVRALFPEWVALSGIEGFSYRTKGTGIMRYSYYNTKFGSLLKMPHKNTAGDIWLNYTFKIEYFHSNGHKYSEVIHPNSGFGAIHFTIKNCTNPDYPVIIDTDQNGIADLCYKKTLSCEAQSAQLIDNRLIESRDLVGDPIACSSGKSIQSELIYTDAGPDPLSYRLNYETSPVKNNKTPPCIMASHQTSPSVRKIMDNKQMIAYQVSHGGMSNCQGEVKNHGYAYIYFWIYNRGGSFRSTEIDGGTFKVNADGSMTETRRNGKVLQYNADGRLVSRQRKFPGKWQSKNYTYTPAGKVSSITNRFGKKLQFFYDTTHLMERLLTPDGRNYYFEHDARGNLTKVIFPDDTPNDLTNNPVIQYLFEDTRFPRHMTGKINENGERIASWKFDSNGRAISSTRGAGKEKVELDYSVVNQTRVTTYVSDTLKNDVIHHFKTVAGVKRLVQYEQLPCNGCEVGSWFYEYKKGRLSRSINPKGVTREIEYLNGIKYKEYEARGTPEERLTLYSWHDEKRLHTKTTDNLEVEYHYWLDNLNSVGYKDKISGESRRTNYSYNESSGLLQVVDGPRKDVRDIIYYSYHADTKGDLKSITNSLGHTIQFKNYDANGRFGQVIDANGVITDFTYTVKGWLKTQTKNNALTQYIYYPTGALKSVISPSGETLSYLYDDAERLTAITDLQGNRIDYIRDLMGNVTATHIKDTKNVLRYSQQRVYNALGQLVNSLGNYGQSQQITFDKQGNPEYLVDALKNQTTNQFDSLNRLKKSIDPDKAETSFIYDTHDRLTHLTDAEKQVTEYSYNAFGDLKKVVSADTGTTVFTYDLAGNMLTRTDARGMKVAYVYDALNRVLSESYTDPSENVTYQYDDTTSGNKGIGRLTKVTDQSGSTHYFYNNFGQVSKVTQIIEGKTFVTSYHFDVNGRQTGMTYPGGSSLTYGFNQSGRIESMSLTQLNQQKSLASQIKYLPFGPMTQLTRGNNQKLKQIFDLDYRLTDKEVVSGVKKSYEFDLVNNISGITDVQNGGNKENLTYDKLSRLLSVGNRFAYSYDKKGNRLSKTESNLSDIYHYSPLSLKLESISGSNPVAFTQDPAGNLLTRGELAFQYNQKGRLKTATKTGVNARYVYQFNGQRATKQVNGVTTHYLYNLSGQLIAESDNTGNILKEYVYFNGQPFAQLVGNQVYYYHNSHLGTPEVMTDANQNIVWQASHSPFGEAVVTVNTVENNIRFPGQYFDKESGLHYNYFRYYDTESGRYITSDPIGLNGGVNTYGYVGGNPVNYVDPKGLSACSNAATVAGSVIGGGLGYLGGGIIGGISGGAAGSIVPVAGTIAGAGAGAASGSTAGGAGGAVVGGAIGNTLGNLFCPSASKVSDQVNKANSPANTSRTIPWPDKNKGKYTCICRADANGKSECNDTSGGKDFAFGWGIANDIVTAWKIAEKMAKEFLGAKSVHHVQCKCTGPKGEKQNRGTS